MRDEIRTALGLKEELVKINRLNGHIIIKVSDTGHGPGLGASIEHYTQGDELDNPSTWQLTSGFA